MQFRVQRIRDLENLALQYRKLFAQFMDPRALLTVRAVRVRAERAQAKRESGQLLADIVVNRFGD